MAGLDPVSATTQAVGGIVGKIANTIDELYTSEEELAKIELEQSKLTHAVNVKQIELNQTETKHPSLFIAGWRPMIGWIGAGALAWEFVLKPITVFIMVSVGHSPELPEIDTTILINLVMALLGVGAMRSYDKVKGVDTKSIQMRNKVAGMTSEELDKELGQWER